MWQKIKKMDSLNSVDNSTKSNERSLFPQITKNTQDKNVKLFNQRLLSIAQLQRDKEDLITKIKAIKLLFDAKSADIFKEKNQALVTLIEEGIKRMKSKSLTDNEKVILAEYLNEMCLEIEENLIEETREFRDQIHELTPAKFNEEAAQYITETLGLKTLFDLKDLQNLDEEDMKAKYGDDVFEKFTNAIPFYSNEDNLRNDFNQEEKDNRKKTKKQLERELAKKELAQLTDKDFNALYKSLSKRVHPDLEKDSFKKSVKEEIMKQLVEAKENRDLLQLLLIENNLNNQDGIESTSFDIEKIKRFNNILLEQKISLEQELYRIKFHYQDTSFYYQNFNAPKTSTTEKKINAYVLELKREIITIHLTKEMLNTVKETKEFLRDVRKAEEEDFFRMLGFYDDDDEDY